MTLLDILQRLTGGPLSRAETQSLLEILGQQPGVTMIPQGPSAPQPRPLHGQPWNDYFLVPDYDMATMALQQGHRPVIVPDPYAPAHDVDLEQVRNAQWESPQRLFGRFSDGRGYGAITGTRSAAFRATSRRSTTGR